MIRGVLVLSFIAVIVGGEPKEDSTTIKDVAHWTEWEPLSPCTAKPCNCNPDEISDDCDTGKMTEIRFCNRTIDDNPCEYKDGIGPIRLVENCKNDKKNCPGWSEWRTDPKYKCKCTNDKKHHVLKVRKCNNPEPLFKDVGCLVEYAEDRHSLTKPNESVQEEEMFDREHCPCIETTVTTRKPTTTTKGPNCSVTDYYTELDPECEFTYIEDF